MIQSNQDEEEHAIKKLLKLEEQSVFNQQIKEEAQEEERIVPKVYQFDVKEGLETLSKIILLQKQTELDPYPYVQTMLLGYLSSFKPIFPAFTAQEFQDYKVMQDRAVLNRIQCSPPRYENSAVLVNEHEQKSKSPKHQQSKYKNCYGLVTGRVIKSIKEYLNLRHQGLTEQISSSARLRYIHVRIGNIGNLKKFESFLNKYHQRSLKLKRNRGKSTVYNYLSEDKINGLILVELIESFLRSENPDFVSYVSGSKKQITQVLGNEDNLSYLREAFREMKFDIEKN